MLDGAGTDLDTKLWGPKKAVIAGSLGLCVHSVPSLPEQFCYWKGESWEVKLEETYSLGLRLS